jgi:hypothetical protein
MTKDVVVVLILLVLAIAWSVVVVGTVVGSAPTGAASLIAFEREIANPGNPEGTWILCAMVASAGLSIAWAIGAWRRRRHGKRLKAELDDRWAQRHHEEAVGSARGRLLESRERELEASIVTLTAQRDALYDEIRSAGTAAPPPVEEPEAPRPVVRIPDPETEGSSTDRNA